MKNLKRFLLILVFGVLVGLAGCSGSGGDDSDDGSGEEMEDIQDNGDNGDNGEEDYEPEQGTVSYQLGDDTSMVISLSPPQTLLVEPSEIAEALDDPSTMNLGVWSLVYSLGIGVYRPDGMVVLQGAETSEDDLWLYDRQIPQLAKAATVRSSFSRYYEKVAETFEFRYGINAEAMLALYATEYTVWNDDSFLAVLFESMGLNFYEEDPELTQLQELLLFWDGFIEADGYETAGTTAVTPMAIDHLPPDVPDAIGEFFCQRNPEKCRPPEPDQERYNICIDDAALSSAVKNHGSGVIVGWISKTAGYFKSVVDFTDALLMDGDITRHIWVDTRSTHVMECPVSSPLVTATATLTIGGDSDVADIIAECGRQAGLVPGRFLEYSTGQPITSVPVSWDVSGPGLSRVLESDWDIETDMYGQARMIVGPRTTNECEGDPLQDEVNIDVTFNTEILVTFLRGANVTDAMAVLINRMARFSDWSETSFYVEYRLEEDDPDHPDYSPQPSASRTLPRTYSAGDPLGW